MQSAANSAPTNSWVDCGELTEDQCPEPSFWRHSGALRLDTEGVIGAAIRPDGVRLGVVGLEAARPDNNLVVPIDPGDFSATNPTDDKLGELLWSGLSEEFTKGVA